MADQSEEKHRGRSQHGRPQRDVRGIRSELPICRDRNGQDDFHRVGYLDPFERLADMHGVHDNMTQPTAGALLLAQ